MTAVPTQIGPYRVVRKLGQGGMGVVFEVADPDLPRTLALKLILDHAADEVAQERFWREADALGRVRHRGVVRIHGLGQVPEGTYLVLEKVEGRPLDEVCAAGALEPRRAARIARELADAVSALHEAGIVHRDIKPQNVILGADDAPVLLDFGLVRDASAETLTKTGTSLGTLPYMSPEQIAGTRASAACDVWALGLVLHELLCGERAFQGEPTSLIGAILHAQPAPPSVAAPGVPPALDAVVRACLVKAPGARYPGAAALRDDLDRFLRGAPPLALVGVRRRRTLAGLGALAALVLAGAAALGVTRARRADPLAPDEVARRCATLEREARRLLADPAPLASDAAIAGLLAEVEALAQAAGDAPDAAALEALGRARGPSAALAVLARLARGEPVERGEVLDPGPAGLAARAAIAALGSGEPSVAARDLGQALARGVRRPDLRGWRARALLRAGGPRAGEGALEDLDALAAARPLSPGERALRAEALLAAGQLEAAEAALAGLGAAAPPRLVRRAALAHAARLHASDPAAALALLEGAPPGGAPDDGALDDGAALRASAVAALEADLRAVGARLRGEDEARLLARARLARAARPAEPLPPAVLERLGDLADPVDGYANDDLALALAGLAPDDPVTHRRVAELTAVRVQGGARRKLLPVLRRAVELARSPDERTHLEVGLCLAQVELDEAEAGLELAESLLTRCADDAQRAQVLGARAFGLLQRGRAAEGLACLEDAERLGQGGSWKRGFAYYRLRILDALGRREEALEAAGQVLIGQSFVTWEQDEAMVRLWQLARALDAPAAAAGPLETLLGIKADAVSGDWRVRLAWLELGLGRATEAAINLERGAEWIRATKKGAKLRALLPRVEALAVAVRRGDPAARADLEVLCEEIDALEP